MQQPTATVDQATCTTCGHPVDSFTHDVDDVYYHAPVLDEAVAAELAELAIAQLLA